MFDIYFPHGSEKTWMQWVLCHLFYIIYVFCFWKKYINKNHTTPNNNFPLVIGFLLYLVFSFDGGDYFHYLDGVHHNQLDGCEPIYTIIADIVGHNYLLWRLVVWGSAFFLYLKTAKRFELNPYVCALILFAFFNTTFAYARASLGMAVLFYGLSIAINPNKSNRFLSSMLGIIIIASSFLFHRSMAVVSLTSLILFIPLTKRILPLYVLIFALSGAYIEKIMGFVAAGNFLTEDIQDRVMEYSTDTRTDGSFMIYNVYEQIKRFMEYSIFFLSFIICTYKFYYSEHKDTISSSILKVHKVTFAILLLAVGTLLGNAVTVVLFYRFLYAAIIPITIILVYMYNNKIITLKSLNRLFCFVFIVKMFGFFKGVFGNTLH